MKRCVMLMFLFLATFSLNAQCDDIYVETFYDHFAPGLDCDFRLHTCDANIDSNDIVIYQLKYITDNNIEYQWDTIYPEYKVFDNDYMVKVRDYGIVIVEIDIDSEVCEKSIPVKSLPVDAHLSRNKISRNDSISIGEFKAQYGIYTPIIGFGFDAKCRVDQFDIIKISASGSRIRRTNIGGKYDDRAREIISKTEKDDIYIFSNIMIRCPGDKIMREIPGGTVFIK